MWEGCGKDVERMWIPVQKGIFDKTKYKHEYYYSGINPVAFRGHNDLKEKNFSS